MFQLNNPPEKALTAVFLLVTQKKRNAVNPRLADTLNAPRSHCLRVEKDSSEEEMGFLDSTNEEKMVQRKVRGDQSHVRQSKRELQVGESRSSERTIWTLKREQFIDDSEKVRDFSSCLRAVALLQFKH